MQPPASRPRTADSQCLAAPRLPLGQPLLPGDLVDGTQQHIYRVGVYIEQGRMVHASDVSQSITVADYPMHRDDFVAAGRPLPNECRFRSEMSLSERLVIDLSYRPLAESVRILTGRTIPNASAHRRAGEDDRTAGRKR
jgi:hypothetical protein